jgi:hypothetical protein
MSKAISTRQSGADSGSAARLTLYLHEVAFVLDWQEEAVASLLEAEVLADVSRDRNRRVAVDDLRRLVAAHVTRGNLSPLSLFLMEEVAAERLAVPRTYRRSELVRAYLRPGSPR